MAQKTINELQLRSSVSDDVNVPGDDGIQTYRTTGLQWYNYMATKFINATGDLIYGASATTAAKLAIGSAQQLLKPVAGIPAWAWPMAVQRTATTTDAINATTDYIILYNANGGAFTATLPTAASVAGKMYILKKIGTDFNVVTVSTTSSQTIDGIVGTTLNTPNETIVVFSDGSNWILLDRKIPSVRTSWTPTFVGLGTPTNINMFWTRYGNRLDFDGTFNVGTSTGVTATMSLPNSWTSAITVAPALVGSGHRDTNTAAQIKTISVIGPASASNVLNFALVDTAASVSPLAAALGNAIFVSSAFYAIKGSVPITTWNG